MGIVFGAGRGMTSVVDLAGGCAPSGRKDVFDASSSKGGEASFVDPARIDRLVDVVAFDGVVYGLP